MPIPILLWFVAAAAVGFAAGYFWEDVIKPWAIRAAGKILDYLDSGLKFFSEGVVYLTKKGQDYIKELRVYTKDKNTGQYGVEISREKLTDNQVPDDIRAELSKQSEMEVGRIQTRQ
jgi:hypothetical protein